MCWACASITILIIYQKKTRHVYISISKLINPHTYWIIYQYDCREGLYMEYNVSYSYFPARNYYVNTSCKKATQKVWRIKRTTAPRPVNIREKYTRYAYRKINWMDINPSELLKHLWAYFLELLRHVHIWYGRFKVLQDVRVLHKLGISNGLFRGSTKILVDAWNPQRVRTVTSHARLGGRLTLQWLHNEHNGVSHHQPHDAIAVEIMWLVLSRNGGHTTPVLVDLQWLPVKQRIEFKFLLTYKALCGPAPAYLRELLVPYTLASTLRSTENTQLTPPRYWLQNFGKISFAAVAPALWNNLPLNNPHLWTFLSLAWWHICPSLLSSCNCVIDVCMLLLFP